MLPQTEDHILIAGGIEVMLGPSIVRILGLAALATALAACSTAVWQTDKYVLPGYAGKLDSITIVTLVTEEATTFDARTFAEQLSGKFRDCAIKTDSAVRWAGPGDPGLSVIEAALGGTNPDAVFVIRDTENSGVSFLTGSGLLHKGTAKAMGRYYSAELYERYSKKTLWNSELYLAGHNGIRTYDAQEKARLLASDVASFLAADRVLRSCPAAS